MLTEYNFYLCLSFDQSWTAFTLHPSCSHHIALLFSWNMADIDFNWIIAGKYRILRQIGAGSFGVSLVLFSTSTTSADYPSYHTGKIYAGFNINSGEEVAIKLETRSSGYLHLENEYKSYQILGHRHVGIPHVKWFGIEKGHTVMALSLLGPSLEDIFISKHRKFALGTVLIIANQLVSHLILVIASCFW